MPDFLQNPIVERARIAAPLDRVFALSTRVELVQKTLGMRPIGGLTSGHITAGSRVHWRGWKFGLPTRHHTLITAFAAPHPGTPGDLAGTQLPAQPVAWFEDSQERGRFAAFRHLHLFRQEHDAVFLEDRIFFQLPFGILGRPIARFVLAPHIRALARQRFNMIRTLAETDAWRPWVNPTPSSPTNPA